MATYFVSSAGSNTSPYDTWAKAATSLATALAAATANGSIVALDVSGVPTADAENAADVTYTFAGNIALICSTNTGTSTVTPTAMSTTSWIGNSTTNVSISFAGTDKRVSIYGLTIRNAGSVTDHIRLNNAVGLHTEYEDCYFWLGNTNTNSRIFPNATSTGGSYTKTLNCIYRFGATSQGIENMSVFECYGGSISSAGSTPSTLMTTPTLSWACSTNAFIGTDLSLITGTLVGNIPANCIVELDRCILGAGVTPLASQTSNPTRGSAEVYIKDCASGDTHGLFGYYNALGSLDSNTSIYFTSGAAAQSWRIVTTANASYATPFISPFIHVYNSSLSAITPYIEILRNNSTTAYTDAEVWGEFGVKTTTGFTSVSFAHDSQTLTGYAAGTTASNQATGAGTGSWTGGTTPWSGKCDSGASMTPAEAGFISGRILVGGASLTVYVDPQIRT